MIVSFLFLITGGYMLTELPEINKLMVFKLIAVFASIPLAVIGFKKSNKVLASFSLLLIIGAYGLAEMSKKRGTKTTASDHLSNNGKDIYTANCMKCHGEDGSLGLAGAIDLSTSTLDNTTAKEVVRIGRGAMMGYGNQLSNEQITKVVDYIETLRK
jgi:mono/diheme cytochrome c family protein